jgi:hypothetical protein
LAWRFRSKSQLAAHFRRGHSDIGTLLRKVGLADDDPGGRPGGVRFDALRRRIEAEDDPARRGEMLSLVSESRLRGLFQRYCPPLQARGQPGDRHRPVVDAVGSLRDQLRLAGSGPLSEPVAGPLGAADENQQRTAANSAELAGGDGGERGGESAKRRKNRSGDDEDDGGAAGNLDELLAQLQL